MVRSHFKAKTEQNFENDATRVGRRIFFPYLSFSFFLPSTSDLIVSLNYSLII